MPDIAIDQSTFERLQRHAKPFVDTPDLVVNRALDALEQRERNSPPLDAPTIAERRIDTRNLPDMTHTKVLDALCEGKHVAKPNWNRLLDWMLIRARKQLASFDHLRKLIPVNMVQGRKEDEGFRYLGDIDLSVQGQPANEACRALAIAAQSLRIEVDVTFVWRTKEAAAFPGERARLYIPGSTSD